MPQDGHDVRASRANGAMDPCALRRASTLGVGPKSGGPSGGKGGRAIGWANGRAAGRSACRSIGRAGVRSKPRERNRRQRLPLRAVTGLQTQDAHERAEDVCQHCLFYLDNRTPRILPNAPFDGAASRSHRAAGQPRTAPGTTAYPVPLPSRVWPQRHASAPALQMDGDGGRRDASKHRLPRDAGVSGHEDAVVLGVLRLREFRSKTPRLRSTSPKLGHEYPPTAGAGPVECAVVTCFFSEPKAPARTKQRPPLCVLNAYHPPILLCTPPPLPRPPPIRWGLC